MSRMDQNNHKPLEFPKDREAFERRAFEAEDGCISVGGLAHRLGMFSQQREPMALATVNAATALAKLVELWRRQQWLTVEAFAKRANLTEAEVVGIESGEIVPEPRALFQVSQVIPVLVQTSRNLVLVSSSPEVVVPEVPYISRLLPLFDHLSNSISISFYFPLYSAPFSQSGLRIPQPCSESQQKQQADLAG